MKVILNKDVKHLGEEGDAKVVAAGYARNYLFPRKLAFPHTPAVLKIFEGRKAEIEARKAQKREDAKSAKEKIEALQLSVTVPASSTGKLYGAVSSQTISELLSKEGFEIERKRVEIPGNSIKTTGKYKVSVKLYENSSASLSVEVVGQVDQKSAQKEERKARAKKEDASSNDAALALAENAAEKNAAPVDDAKAEDGGASVASEA